jgi:hypothetical protein
LFERRVWLGKTAGGWCDGLVFDIEGGRFRLFYYIL